jgi:hypothetical protein
MILYKISIITTLLDVCTTFSFMVWKPSLMIYEGNFLFHFLLPKIGIAGLAFSGSIEIILVPLFVKWCIVQYQKVPMPAKGQGLGFRQTLRVCGKIFSIYVASAGVVIPVFGALSWIIGIGLLHSLS